MKNFLLFGAIAIAVFFSTVVYSQDYPYIYKGFRPMGMGGAFVAVSNDANALFYNPAGLADVPAERTTLISLEVEQSKDGYKGYQDLMDLDTEDPDETASFLKDYMGDNNHAAITVFPSLVKPNFAFGIYGTARSDFSAHNNQSPEILVNNVSDAGAAVGFAKSYYDDNLVLGVNAKLDMRRSLNKEYTLTEITAGDFDDMMDDDTENGVGALFDIGALYRIGEFTSPGGRKIKAQAGMTVSNLVGSSMGNAENLTAHADFGFALKGDDVTLALDYVDVFDNFSEDSDIPKRLHMGVEYIYNKVYFLRAGLSQGYPTYGFGWDGGKIQIDLLTYTEEMGAYSGQMKDRRYAFRFAYGF